MKSNIVIYCIVPALILMQAGCAHKSYHPWLDEDNLVHDSRISGVWHRMDNGSDGPAETEIVIVRPVSGIPTDCNGNQGKEIPAGYYSISWIDNEAIEAESTLENSFIKPKKLFGGLYRIEDTLFVQLWGSTLENGLLVVPMYSIFKVNFKDDTLYLYDLRLGNMKPADLTQEGLIFEAEKEKPTVFFSQTVKLMEFIRSHMNEDGFFSENPTLILKQIRDLGGESSGDAYSSDR